MGLCSGIVRLALGASLVGAGVLAAPASAAWLSPAPEFSARLASAQEPSARAASTRAPLWVSRSGDDDASGSPRSPMRTIDGALERARPGQTIFLRSGRYPEPTEASPRGRLAAAITLRPAPGATVVASGGFKLIHAAYVRVIGITFDGSGGDGWGTSIWASHRIMFAHNEITGYGASAQGVLIRDGSTGVRLVGNNIHDVGGNMRYDHGIYCQSARGTLISHNLIHDVSTGYGIHLFGDCDGTRIVGNIIAHNGLSGIIIAGNDDRGTADRTLIAHNVIADHVVAADSEFGFAVTEYRPGVGNVVRDNVFSRNAARENVDCETCTVRHNVLRDPGFVDPAQGNYALRRTSAVRSMIRLH